MVRHFNSGYPVLRPVACCRSLPTLAREKPLMFSDSSVSTELHALAYSVYSGSV